MNLVSRAARADRGAVGLGPEDLPRRAPYDARRPGGVRIVVHEDGERDVLLLDELASVSRVPRPDGDDIRPSGSDVLVSVAHLRSVMPAVQSPEVPEEDQDDGTIRPVVAQAMILTVGAGQDEIGQNVDIHRAAHLRSLLAFPAPFGVGTSKDRR